MLLTMAGNADKDVAAQLGIKLDTVRVYWKRIRAKTQRATRAEVIALIASETTHEELDAAQKENEHLLTEIVRRRGVEEELAIYREVFARTCVGLAVDGGEGASLLRINQAFADLHGYSVDELIGRPIEILLAKTEKKVAAKVKQKIDQVGEALLREKHAKKDGFDLHVLKQVTSIKGGKSRVHFRIYTVLAMDQVQSPRAFVEQQESVGERDS